MKKCLILIGIASAMLGSCQKEEGSDVGREPMDELVKADQGLKNVMLTLVSNGLGLDAAKEIHSSISKTEEFGLDEISYAKELLSPSPEKFNGAPVAKKIMRSFEGSRFNKVALLARGSSSGGFADKPSKVSSEGQPVEFDRLSLQEILSQDIQFYWPNHENWDGITLPLVALVSDEDVITAYRQEIGSDGNVVLVPVRMTEEDAEITPVLIIGNEEIPYEHVIDESVVILSSRNNSEEPLPISPTPSVTPLASTKASNTGRDIYTVYLGSFQATQHHEPWSRGGSEFRIHFTGTPDFEIKSEADKERIKNLTSTRVVYLDVRRRDVKRRTWFHFGTSQPLLTTWAPELVYGHLLMREEDPGSSIDLKVTLGLKYKALDIFKIEASTSIKSRDDIFNQMSVHRDFLLSTGNGYHNKNWTVYEAGGIYFTLPIVKHRVYN